MMAVLHTVAPPLYERMMSRQVEVDEFQERPAPPTQGNLYQPVPEGTEVSGGWKAPGGADGSPLRRAAVVGLVAGPPSVAAWVWLRRRK